jgi:prepilin-type N-terminal cleavage/methylation domain-containing protein
MFKSVQRARSQKGFTLIELLIAIVVVGILTAVVIVGISGLTNKGQNSACTASQDSIKAAEAVHYANTGSYTIDLKSMQTKNELDVPSNVSITGTNNDTIGATGTGGWSTTVNLTGGTVNFSACP